MRIVDSICGLTGSDLSSCSYAILLADTVRVGQESAVLLTEGTKRASEVILDEGVSWNVRRARTPT